MRKMKLVGGLVATTITLTGCAVSLAPEFRGAVDRVEFDLIPLAKGEKTPADYTEADVADLERWVRISRAVLDEVPEQ